MPQITTIALVAQLGRGNMGYGVRGEQEGSAEQAGKAIDRPVEGVRKSPHFKLF